MTSPIINNIDDAVSVSSTLPDYRPETPDRESRASYSPSSYHSPTVRSSGNPFLGLPEREQPAYRGAGTGGHGTPHPSSISLADRIGERVASPPQHDDHPDDYLIGSNEELHDTWELCKAALLYFRDARRLPGGLANYTAQILSNVVCNSAPPTLEDAERDIGDYPQVVGTLRSYQGELQEYVVPDLISLSAAASVGREPEDREEQETAAEAEGTQGRSSSGSVPDSI